MSTFELVVFHSKSINAVYQKEIIVDKIIAHTFAARESGVAQCGSIATECADETCWDSNSFSAMKSL
jgi:hypothetical protein